MKIMMDCKKCHLKCKAICCGITPIPKDIWEKNQDKVITMPDELLEMDGPDVDGLEKDFIIPKTSSGKCTFLNEDYSCNIYADRPPICRKFGDESHIYLTCLYQSKEGRIRSRQEKREITRKFENEAERLTKNIDQLHLILMTTSNSGSSSGP